jgi:hypothetical protein
MHAGEANQIDWSDDDALANIDWSIYPTSAIQLWSRTTPGLGRRRLHRVPPPTPRCGEVWRLYFIDLGEVAFYARVRGTEVRQRDGEG